VDFFGIAVIFLLVWIIAGKGYQRVGVIY